MFDSHCHLTDEKLLPQVDAVLERARAAGVTGVVTIASDAKDAIAAYQLAERFHRRAADDIDVWCTAGIHPHAAGAATAEDRDIVLELIGDGYYVVALGETGLDYYYDTSPRDVQRELFAWHLEQSARTGKPTIVHSRNADEDTEAIIREADRRATGVLHCFAAGQSLFDMAMELGWYISFGGMATFKNFAYSDFLRAVPIDRLLLETDSPYLAPVPMRGKTNEPSFIAHTCAAIASMRGMSAEELAAKTDYNAREFYGKTDFWFGYAELKPVP